ncbi:MAG: type I methionyl aminopeptidase [Firmicutes bacterium]|nr:type I methionyl aminopeptidase [Candidatus Fermentithermobacillaceae bacterium]
MIILKNEQEIELLANAGRVAGLCLKMLGSKVRPGITTAELDRMAEESIRGMGAIPTFKGYSGFPASICTSVNDEVVHGTPDSRRLEEGDIISIDVGATLNGYVGDTAATFPVGEVSVLAERLIQATRESLYAGIAAAVEGNSVGDIGHAVESVARRYGFTVVRDYAGHGVGRKMHEDPSVPNFGIPGTGPVLRRGMVIAIEPMVNAGGHEVLTFRNMKVVTKDGSLSAHFEHTVAVTSKGPRCLTEV